MSRVDRIDRYQREHRWLGFPLAVAYKLFDDRGPYLAALVTYYGFVSLFPLLLLLVSGAGFFLDHAPGVRQQVVDSALANFPGLGRQLRDNINGFHGSGAALALGIVGTLYGALGAMQAAQAALNQIYGVPRNEQPNPLRSRLRSLGLVGLLGTAVLLTTGVGSTVAVAGDLFAPLGPWVRAGGFVVSYLLDIALFVVAFQLLTARDLRVRDVITGGLLAGGVWVLLQTFGSRYVAHEVDRGSSLYGAFGVVLAAVAWLYLQSLALMVAAEINVVAYHGLWPRALLTPFTDDVDLTPADERAYTMYARAQRFKGFETIHAAFARGRTGRRPADRRVTGRDHAAAPAEPEGAELRSG